MIIINSGSENKGGSFKQALINANEWLEEINKEYPEVTMTTHEDMNDGDWNFRFTHGTTKKHADLQIHGFTTEECEKFIFHPRVYWNGSSTAEQGIEDWLTNEYTYKIVYEKKDT